MELRQVPSGTRISVDTNLFLYAISDHLEYGTACNKFFNRVKDEELQGIVSLIVLNELIHKLVIGEIAEKKELNPANVPRYVKETKEVLGDLEAYDLLRDIEDNYNLEVVDLNHKDFRQARKFMKREHLLSNDALQLATMTRLGIKDLATDDPDFEAIENITIWKPTSHGN